MKRDEMEELRERVESLERRVLDKERRFSLGKFLIGFVAAFLFIMLAIGILQFVNAP